jgi:uncharacterized protein YlxW (UPF0749 family)
MMPTDTPWLGWLIGTILVAVITAGGGIVVALATSRSEKEKTAVDSWRGVTERQDHELAELRTRLDKTDARVAELLDKVDGLDLLRRLYRRHVRDWRDRHPDRAKWPRADPRLVEDLGDEIA